MLRKLIFLIFLFSTFCMSVSAWGQTSICPAVSTVSQERNAVGCTLPYLYGPTVALPVFQGGASVGTTGFADFGNNKSALPATLGTELTTLPLSAPASGYVFQLDKASGLEVRSTQSLGPIRNAAIPSGAINCSLRFLISISVSLPRMAFIPMHSIA